MVMNEADLSGYTLAHGTGNHAATLALGGVYSRYQQYRLRNSNAARAGNTGGGWYPTNRVLVKAGAAASDPSHGSENGWILPQLQGGFQQGRARLQRESGMHDDLSFVGPQDTAARRRLDAAVWAKSGGKCWYCGRSVSIGAANIPGRMCIDHLHSQVRGGGHEFANLVPSCRPCNSSKGGRDLEAFRWTAYRKARGIPSFSQEQRDWLESQGITFIGLPETLFWFEREGL